MLFNVYKLFGRDPGTVMSALGVPVATKDAYGIHFSNYVKNGARIEVQYENRKANAFIVQLPVPAPTPEAALSLVGVDVRKRPPFEKSRVSVSWHGRFPHPNIKEVSATNFGKGWTEIDVQQNI